MILLEQDCLLIVTESGESFPCLADNIQIELAEGAASWLSPELVQEAIQAVSYYFRNDLHKNSVTITEFTNTLQTVFRGLGLAAETTADCFSSRVMESNLCAVAEAAGWTLELWFYPRLREELRRQITRSPHVLRFTSLQECARRLAGVKRWNKRCTEISDQINRFIRDCLVRESSVSNCSLVVC
jgi:hypothetical protein